jgi:hypothetical protein
MLALIIVGISGGILSATLSYDNGLVTILLGYVGGGLFSTIAAGVFALPRLLNEHSGSPSLQILQDS